MMTTSSFCIRLPFLRGSLTDRHMALPTSLLLWPGLPQPPQTGAFCPAGYPFTPREAAACLEDLRRMGDEALSGLPVGAASTGNARAARHASEMALLREFGFACEEFGDGAILIRALPADIPAEDAAASLEDLAGRLVETHHADPESARDALLHTMACKAAIKGGWKSDQRELRVLVDKVQSGEVRFCPHGRPVAVKLTKYELEKMFKRA